MNSSAYCLRKVAFLFGLTLVFVVEVQGVRNDAKDQHFDAYKNAPFDRTYTTYPESKFTKGSAGIGGRKPSPDAVSYNVRKKIYWEDKRPSECKNNSWLSTYSKDPIKKVRLQAKRDLKEDKINKAQAQARIIIAEHKDHLEKRGNRWNDPLELFDQGQEEKLGFRIPHDDEALSKALYDELKKKGWKVKKFSKNGIDYIIADAPPSIRTKVQLAMKRRDRAREVVLGSTQLFFGWQLVSQNAMLFVDDVKAWLDPDEQSAEISWRMAEHGLYAIGGSGMMVSGWERLRGARGSGLSSFGDTLSKASSIAFWVGEGVQVYRYNMGMMSYRAFCTQQAVLFGGWTGGYMGGWVGQSVGTCFNPGIGSIAGSIGGGYIGNYLGQKAGRGLVDYHFEHAVAERDRKVDDFVFAYYGVN